MSNVSRLDKFKSLPADRVIIMCRIWDIKKKVIMIEIYVKPFQSLITIVNVYIIDDLLKKRRRKKRMLLNRLK